MRVLQFFDNKSTVVSQTHVAFPCCHKRSLPAPSSRKNKAPAAPKQGVSRAAAAKLKAILGGVEFPPLSKATTKAPRQVGKKSYADVVRSQGSGFLAKTNGSDYLKCLMQPIDTPCGVRWPDETLVPTSTNKFISETTYVVTGTTFACGLGWKAIQKGAAAAFTGNGAFPAGSVWSTILQPQDAPTLGLDSDYGPSQATWATLSSVDRTIACGLRVRLTDLPPNKFMKPGKLYFIQYTPEEFPGVLAATLAANEPYFQQLVTASKGFTLTTADADAAGGVSHPFLPMGPNSFVYSGTDAGFAAGTTNNATSAAVQQNLNVSANGGLWVIGFGVTAGTAVNVTFAHHLEFVPTVSAAGLLEPVTSQPDTMLRQDILSNIAHRSALIRGANTLKPLIDAGLANPNATAGLAGAASGMVASVAGGPYGYLGAQGLGYALSVAGPSGPSRNFGRGLVLGSGGGYGGMSGYSKPF